jgi:hypothetical protein
MVPASSTPIVLAIGQRRASSFARARRRRGRLESFTGGCLDDLNCWTAVADLAHECPCCVMAALEDRGSAEAT